MNTVIERAVRNLATVEAMVIDAKNIYTASGLTLDTEHTDAAVQLVAFLSFVNGDSLAADSTRRAKLSKVRSDAVL